MQIVVPQAGSGSREDAVMQWLFGEDSVSLSVFHLG